MSKETLRKHPPVAILNRVCTKDIDLPTTNLHISKGVDVVIPVLAIQRDPNIYPDPMKFDPERFSEKNIANRHPYAYLPFGEGPRICIGMFFNCKLVSLNIYYWWNLISFFFILGMRFGLAQTKVALINALKNYRYTLGPNQPVPYSVDPGSLVFGADTLHVKIEKL